MPARNSRGECYDGSHGTKRTARADGGVDCEKCGKHEEIVVKRNHRRPERMKARDEMLRQFDERSLWWLALREKYIHVRALF